MFSPAQKTVPSHFKRLSGVEFDRNLSPFTSLEDEFRKAARKLNKMRTRDEIKTPSPKHKHSPNVLFELEKIQGILDVSSRNAFENAEAVLRITSPEEVVEEELKKISERIPPKQTLIVKSTEQGKPNKGLNFESFHNMQVRINKTIHDTVEQIENNITLLPEKRKNNRIIDRLSTIDLTKTNPKHSLELPKLVSPGKSASALLSPVRDSHNKTEFSTILSTTAKDQPRKTAATDFFHTKTQQKKVYKSEAEKSELRKTCLESFKNVNPKIKDLSNQYLFKLTQNNDSCFGRNSPRNTDQSVAYGMGNSTFYGFPNVSQHDLSGTGGLYSPVGNSSFLNTSGQFGVSSKCSPGLGSLSPKRFKSSTTKAQNKKSIDFGPVEPKQNQFLYEGMGLLTLHQMKSCALRTSNDFAPDYFQIGVGKLSYKDIDHVKKRTGKNIKHLLFDKMISEKDLLRLEPRDLKTIL